MRESQLHPVPVPLHQFIEKLRKIIIITDITDLYIYLHIYKCIELKTLGRWIQFANMILSCRPCCHDALMYYSIHGVRVCCIFVAFVVGFGKSISGHLGHLEAFSFVMVFTVVVRHYYYTATTYFFRWLNSTQLNSLLSLFVIIFTFILTIQDQQ